MVGRAEQQRIARLLAVWNKAKFSRFGFNFEYVETDQKFFLNLVYSEAFKRKTRGTVASPATLSPRGSQSAQSNGFPHKKPPKPKTKDIAVNVLAHSAENSSSQKIPNSFSFDALQSAEKVTPFAQAARKLKATPNAIPELTFEHSPSDRGLGTGSSMTNKNHIPRNSLASQQEDFDEQPRHSGSASKRSFGQAAPQQRLSRSRPAQDSTPHLNLDLLNESLDERQLQPDSSPFRGSKKSSDDASDRGAGPQMKVIRIAKKSPRSQPADQQPARKAGGPLIFIEAVVVGLHTFGVLVRNHGREGGADPLGLCRLRVEVQIKPDGVISLGIQVESGNGLRIGGLRSGF